MLRLRLAELPRTYAALWQVADNLRVPVSNTAPARQIHGSRALRRKDNGGARPSAPIVAAEQTRRGVPGKEFQDLIERWNHGAFYSVGTAMGAGTAALAFSCGPLAISPWLAAGSTWLFWKMGWEDLSQDQHTIRRNFPVLGRARYILEMLRPEVRQYFIESDQETSPFSREQRSIVYARSVTRTKHTRERARTRTHIMHTHTHTHINDDIHTSVRWIPVRKGRWTHCRWAPGEMFIMKATSGWVSACHTCLHKKRYLHH